MEELKFAAFSAKAEGMFISFEKNPKPDNIVRRLLMSLLLARALWSVNPCIPKARAPDEIGDCFTFQADLRLGKKANRRAYDLRQKFNRVNLANALDVLSGVTESRYRR